MGGDRLVYLDLAEAREEDVRVARGYGSRLVAPYDVAWSAPGTPDHFLPGPRAEPFRADLDRALQAIAGAVERSPILRRSLEVRGCSTIEASWFDWFFSVAPVAHPAWALGRLLRDHQPERVVVVTRDPAPWVKLATVAPIEIAARPEAQEGRAPAPPAWRRRAGAMRRWAAGVARGVDAGRAGEADPPSVVFAEDFPHLARALVAPAAIVRDSGTAEVRFAAARDEVLAAARDAGFPAADVRAMCSRQGHLRASARAAGAAGAARAAVAGARAGGLLPGGRFAGALAAPFAAATASAWWRGAEALELWHLAIATMRPAALATATYTGNSNERAAVLAARNHGVPTVFVQHGLVTAEAWKARPIHDRYLVWGRQAARGLAEAGAAPATIVSTGSSKLPQPGAPAATGRPASALSVLFLPSRTGGRFVSRAQAEAMLCMVRSAVEIIGDARLTVKVHPDDRSGLFDGFAADAATRVVHHGDTAALIIAADVVVVATSTAGYEACALDRPVVVVRVPGVGNLIDYDAYDAADVVASAGELAAAVLRLEADRGHAERRRLGRRRLADDVFGEGPADPRACTAEVFRDLVSGSRR